MPIAPLDTTIELDDFSSGIVLQAEEVGVPPNALVDGTNVLLDPITATTQTREGYKRVRELGAALDGYRLYAMHPYTTKGGVSYLIAVFSNDVSSAADNIKVYAYGLNDGSWNRIDASGRAWVSANGRHWGASVDGVYYGGGPAEKMYSWDGTTWNADPGTPNFPAWIALTDANPTSTQRRRDYAFKHGQSVVYQGEAFQAIKDNRFDKWDEEVKKYKKGDKVSTTYDWNGKGAYWRSWEATEGHEPTDDNKPGSNPGQGKGVWKRVMLPPPLDEDGKLNAKSWNRVPDAPKTHIAVWHGNRLFARNDAGIGGRQTLLYSRLAKVGDPDNDEKGTIGKAGDPQWDPDDWRTGGAPGAGFQPFETEEGDPITGLVSFGYYLLIFKRFSVHVIAGINPDTWTVRKLGDVGTAYSKAHTEHEGFVYFLSDRGFYRTDGTEVTPAPGAAKINQWFRNVIDWDTEPKDIELWSFKGLVWMTLPTSHSSNNNRVVVYEPETQSFWIMSIGATGEGGIQTACVARKNSNDQLFFSTVNLTGTATFATYSWMGTPFESPSVKNLGGVLTTNYCANPSFTSTNQWDKPRFWNETNTDRVKAKATKAAAYRGKVGMELSNTREAGSISGQYGGYEGVWIGAQLPAGAARMQMVVRRKNWQKNPERKPAIDFLVSGSQPSPSGWRYLGEGWYKAWYNFNASGTPQELGIMTAPGTTVEVDTCIFTEGSGEVDYFDGLSGEVGGDSIYVGAQRPYIMQYGHPEAKDANGNWTDDDQQVAYSGSHINWHIRTPWLTFGAVQEERRIRRLWSLVRGTDISVGLRTFINFNGADAGSYVESTGADAPVYYHEGQLPDDCHSVQVEIEGNRSPAAALAIALDTEPRRIRFGRR